MLFHGHYRGYFMKPEILSYMYVLRKEVPFSDKNSHVYIKYICVDILVLGGGNYNQNDFEVSIKDNHIRIVSRTNAHYICLPYSIYVSIGNSSVQEKIVVDKWLENEFLLSCNEEVIERNALFMFASEGVYDLHYV